jgi:hypothetical protein
VYPREDIIGVHIQMVVPSFWFLISVTSESKGVSAERVWVKEILGFVQLLIELAYLQVASTAIV